jgi:hypothetical protein
MVINTIAEENWRMGGSRVTLGRESLRKKLSRCGEQTIYSMS